MAAMRYPLPKPPSVGHRPRSQKEREALAAILGEYRRNRIRFLRDPQGTAWAVFFGYVAGPSVPPPPINVELKLGVSPAFDALHEMWWSEPEQFAATYEYAPHWHKYLEYVTPGSTERRKRLGQDLVSAESRVPGAPRPPRSVLGQLIADPSRRRWVDDKPLPEVPKPPPGPVRVGFWDRIGTVRGPIAARDLGGAQRSWLVIRYGRPIGVATSHRRLRQLVSSAYALRDPKFKPPEVRLYTVWRDPDSDEPRVHRVSWRPVGRNRAVSADFPYVMGGGSREDARRRAYEAAVAFAEEKRLELLAESAPVFAFEQRAYFLRGELLWYPAIGRVTDDVTAGAGVELSVRPTELPDEDDEDDAGGSLAHQSRRYLTEEGGEAPRSIFAVRPTIPSRWSVGWIRDRLESWLGRGDLPYFTVVPENLLDLADNPFGDQYRDLDLPFDPEEAAGATVPLRGAAYVEEVLRGTRWPVLVAVRGGGSGDRIGGVRPIFDDRPPEGVVAYLLRGSRDLTAGEQGVLQAVPDVSAQVALQRAVASLYRVGVGVFLDAVFSIFPVEYEYSDLFEVYNALDDEDPDNKREPVIDVPTFRERFHEDPGVLLANLVGVAPPVSLVALALSERSDALSDAPTRQDWEAALALFTEAAQAALDRAAKRRQKAADRRGAERNRQAAERVAAVPAPSGAYGEYDVDDPGDPEAERLETLRYIWESTRTPSELRAARERGRDQAFGAWLADYEATTRAEAEARRVAAQSTQVEAQLRAARRLIQAVESGQVGVDQVAPETLAAARRLAAVEMVLHQMAGAFRVPLQALRAVIQNEAYLVLAVTNDDLYANTEIVPGTVLGNREYAVEILDPWGDDAVVAAQGLDAITTAAEQLLPTALAFRQLEAVLGTPYRDLFQVLAGTKYLVVDNDLSAIGGRPLVGYTFTGAEVSALAPGARAALAMLRGKAAIEYAYQRLLPELQTLRAVGSALGVSTPDLLRVRAGIRSIVVRLPDYRLAKQLPIGTVLDEEELLSVMEALPEGSIVTMSGPEAIAYLAEQVGGGSPRENPSGYALSSARGLYRPRVPTISAEVIQKGENAYVIEARHLADGRPLQNARVRTVYPSEADAERVVRALLREFSTRPRVYVAPEAPEHTSVEGFQRASVDARRRAQAALAQAQQIEAGGTVDPRRAIETYYQAGRGEQVPSRRRSTAVRRSVETDGRRTFPRAGGAAPSVSSSLMNPRGVIARSVAAERKVQAGREAQERGAALEAEGLRELGAEPPAPKRGGGPGMGMAMEAQTVPQKPAEPRVRRRGVLLPDEDEKSLPPRGRSGKRTSKRKTEPPDTEE